MRLKFERFVLVHVEIKEKSWKVIILCAFHLFGHCMWV